MLRSLIHLDLSFVQGANAGLFSFFYKQTASLTSIIYWRCFLYSIVYFWCFCQRPNDHKCELLFLGLQFYSIVQHVCLSTNTVQNCFHYSGIFSFPDEFENCSFYVFEELCWDFDGDYIESIDCLWQNGHFYYVNSINLWA